MKQGHQLFIFICLLISILWAVPSGALAAGQTSVKAAQPVKVFYFKDTDTARTSLYKNYKSIDILAPQAYSVDDTGALAGGIDQNILNFIKIKKMKVMPLVTNKGFSQSFANAILDDSNKQDLVIEALTAEALHQGYVGWQVDFEGMRADYRDKFSAFIRRLGEAMKARNLAFSVAVIAQTSDKPADYPNDLWNRVIGAYDYAALASYVDFISVMSYDDPMSKGPVARYGWLQLVIDYSLKYIPAEKISLGIPLYYWKWDDALGKLVSIGGNTGVQIALKKKTAKTGYDTVHEAPYIKYTEQKKKYTVWYENGRSVSKKVELIKNYNLLGLSAWVLGSEGPSVFPIFK